MMRPTDRERLDRERAAQGHPATIVDPDVHRRLAGALARRKNTNPDN